MTNHYGIIDYMKKFDAKKELSKYRAHLETKINSIFRLRSKYNMNFRSPTFNDRYWVSSGANGNLDLLPENSWNKELGLDI